MEPDFSIKFLEMVSDSKRGILLNNAKVMASSIVDLPDAVGPVIANSELIGLTYDQFIKSILLSQGEFARFLK